MGIGMKIISEVPLLNGFINVVRRTILLPSGSTVVREIYTKPDGVAIVAVTPDEQVFLVRQARAGTMNPCSVEIPAGMVDAKKHNNDPLIAAMAELREETGCDPAECHWSSLGYIVTSPGECTCKVHLYLAQNAKVKFEPDLDPDEELERFTWPFMEALQFSHDPKNRLLSDAPSFVGLTRAAVLMHKDKLLYGE